jgi:hypothetical protein
MAARTLWAALLLPLLLAPASAADRDQWLHVVVDEGWQGGDRVRLNIPLTLVEAVLPLIETHEFRHGKVVIEDEDFSREDLKAVLAAVRDAQDGEYVRVEGTDENVRVAKQGKHILVKVTDSHDDVDVKMPVAVLDALLEGENDELNIVAAVTALAEHADGTLLTARDGRETVRIWIDRQNQSDGGEGP